MEMRIFLCIVRFGILIFTPPQFLFVDLKLVLKSCDKIPRNFSSEMTYSLPWTWPAPLHFLIGCAAAVRSAGWSSQLAPLCPRVAIL